MLVFHHIGYLVKQIESSIAAFQSLGYTVERPSRHDSLREAEIAFLIKDGIRVELIQPSSQMSPIYGLLKHYKNSPYHMCYSTDDFEGDVHLLENQGFTVFKEAQPAPCMDDRNVLFLMNGSIGIIELYDNPSFSTFFGSGETI